MNNNIFIYFTGVVHIKR